MQCGARGQCGDQGGVIGTEIELVHHGIRDTYVLII